MDDKLFNINFKRLASWWLFTFWRTKSVLNLMSVLIFYIEELYIEFGRERKDNLRKMKYNYQKFSLQSILNYNHDRAKNRIRIIKASLHDSVYVYTEGETNNLSVNDPKRKWLFGNERPIYLWTEAELYSEYDFIVQIPVNANAPDVPLVNIDQLKADIEFYKLPSKRYQIQTKEY